MKSDHQLKVKEFMVKAGQEIPDFPTEPSLEVRISRAKLIIEEALELIQKGLGLGISFRDHVSYNLYEIDQYMKPEFEEKRDFNFIELLDGFADLNVVNTGTLLACGIKTGNIQQIVDDNNLKKFGPGGYKDEHGKWIKPPGFIGPQEELKAELERQIIEYENTNNSTTKESNNP